MSPVKTWKVTEDSTAGMQVGENHATVAVGSGGKVNGIHVDESGVYIRGDISLMTMPEQIRVGGFWRQNSAVMQMLPSTMAFPIPNLVVDPPLAGLVEMAASVAWAMGFLV